MLKTPLILLIVFFAFSQPAFSAGPKYTLRERFGVGIDQHRQDNSPGRKLDEFQWQNLGVGWYFDWGAGEYQNGGPRSGLEYMALVGGWGKVAPNVTNGLCNQYRSLASDKSKYPDDSMWTVGNEIGWDDGRSSDDYANDFIAWKDCLKSINPTFKVGSGAIISAWHRLYPGTQGCTTIDDQNSGRNFFLRYIQKIKSVDPVKLPDFFVHHGYSHCNGAFSSAEPFKQVIIEHRKMIKDAGLQDRDLIIKEFSDITSDPKPSFEKEKQYITDTVNFLLTAKDSAIGNPGDEYRLVQKWAWFVLNEWQGKSDYPNAALADTYSGTLKPLGLIYQSFIPIPSPSPSLSPSPISPNIANCSLRSRGDINCDGNIDNTDYDIWVDKYSQESKEVGLSDFEIWRRNTVL